MSLRMGFSGRFSKAAARADGRARGRAGGRRGTRRASACAPRAPACREHLQPAAPLCGVWAPWRLTAARTRLISHKTARRGAIRTRAFGSTQPPRAPKRPRHPLPPWLRRRHRGLLPKARSLQFRTRKTWTMPLHSCCPLLRRSTRDQQMPLPGLRPPKSAGLCRAELSLRQQARIKAASRKNQQRQSLRLYHRRRTRRSRAAAPGM